MIAFIPATQAPHISTDPLTGDAMPTGNLVDTMPASTDVVLRRDNLEEPWGFILEGGTEEDSPLIIQKVFPGSIADKEQLMKGDVISAVDGNDLAYLKHFEAVELIKLAQLELTLTISPQPSQPIPTQEPMPIQQHVPMQHSVHTQHHVPLQQPEPISSYAPDTQSMDADDEGGDWLHKARPHWAVTVPRQERSSRHGNENTLRSKSAGRSASPGGRSYGRSAISGHKSTAMNIMEPGWAPKMTQSSRSVSHGALAEPGWTPRPKPIAKKAPVYPSMTEMGWSPKPKPSTPYTQVHTSNPSLAEPAWQGKMSSGHSVSTSNVSSIPYDKVDEWEESPQTNQPGSSTKQQIPSNAYDDSTHYGRYATLPNAASSRRWAPNAGMEEHQGSPAWLGSLRSSGGRYGMVTSNSPSERWVPHGHDREDEWIKNQTAVNMRAPPTQAKPYENAYSKPRYDDTDKEEYMNSWTSAPRRHHAARDSQGKERFKSEIQNIHLVTTTWTVKDPSAVNQTDVTPAEYISQSQGMPVQQQRAVPVQQHGVPVQQQHGVPAQQQHGVPPQQQSLSTHMPGHQYGAPSKQGMTGQQYGATKQQGMVRMGIEYNMPGQQYGTPKVQKVVPSTAPKPQLHQLPTVPRQFEQQTANITAAAAALLPKPQAQQLPHSDNAANTVQSQQIPPSPAQGKLANANAHINDDQYVTPIDEIKPITPITAVEHTPVENITQTINTTPAPDTATNDNEAAKHMPEQQTQQQPAGPQKVPEVNQPEKTKVGDQQAQVIKADVVTTQPENVEAKIIGVQTSTPQQPATTEVAQNVTGNQQGLSELNDSQTAVVCQKTEVQTPVDSTKIEPAVVQNQTAHQVPDPAAANVTDQTENVEQQTKTQEGNTAPSGEGKDKQLQEVKQTDNQQADVAQKMARPEPAATETASATSAKEQSSSLDQLKVEKQNPTQQETKQESQNPSEIKTTSQPENNQANADINKEQSAPVKYTPEKQETKTDPNTTTTNNDTKVSQTKSVDAAKPEVSDKSSAAPTPALKDKTGQSKVNAGKSNTGNIQDSKSSEVEKKKEAPVENQKSAEKTAESQQSQQYNTETTVKEIKQENDKPETKSESKTQAPKETTEAKSSEKTKEVSTESKTEPKTEPQKESKEPEKNEKAKDVINEKKSESKPQPSKEPETPVKAKESSNEKKPDPPKNTKADMAPTQKTPDEKPASKVNDTKDVNKSTQSTSSDSALSEKGKKDDKSNSAISKPQNNETKQNDKTKLDEKDKKSQNGGSTKLGKDEDVSKNGAPKVKKLATPAAFLNQDKSNKPLPGKLKPK